MRSLKRLGYRFAIVSGGFSHVTDRLAADLGIDYARANQLEVADGRLTGESSAPSSTARRRHRRCETSRLTPRSPLDRTIAIGDGANDLDMLAAAGLGVAFNAKPVVREAAHTAVNVPYLDAILYLLGISREDIEAEDEAHGITTPKARAPNKPCHP